MGSRVEGTNKYVAELAFKIKFNYSFRHDDDGDQSSFVKGE